MFLFSYIGKTLIIFSVLALIIILIIYLFYNSYMIRKHGNYVKIDTPKNIKTRSLIESDLIYIHRRIIDMTDREFEYFVARLLALSDNNRYIVTPKSNDGGRDCILWKDGKEIYIECKHFKSDKGIPGRPVIQKLCGAMIENNVSNGILVTLHGSNQNGITTCNSINNSKIANINIEILDIDDLLNICLNIDAYRVYALAGIPKLYKNIS